MNLNDCKLMGRMTRDPELRAIGNENQVCGFGLAVNRVFKSHGEKKEETLFIEVETYGNGAQSVSEYCQKGAEVLVDGYLKLDQWEDKNGNKRSTIKLVARSVQWPYAGRSEGQQRQQSSNDQGGGLSSEPPY